jgi:hypothetical protein
MTHLPKTENTPLVRTDFSNAEAWTALKEIVTTPNADGFQAYVDIIDDPAFDGATFDVPASRPDNHALLIIADRATLTDADHPFLCIHNASGEQVCVIARELWSIENNLSIANMDFDEFVKAAGTDGVFRGF